MRSADIGLPTADIGLFAAVLLAYAAAADAWPIGRPIWERQMQRTNLQRLLAVYERFGSEIAQIPDGWAQQLHRT